MDIPHFDFPVIDAHVHLYPDALAPKVVPILASRFGNAPSFDGTLSGCRSAMAASGIAISINLPVATRPDHVGHTNGFWRKYAKSTDGIASIAALHPATPDAPNVVAEIAAAGFAGIKFHPEYQEFGFNDPLMDDIWAAMAERNLVAYLHAGGERVFAPPYRSSPSEIRTLHRRFPTLRIVAAHLGGFGMWDETEETLVDEEVTLDLSHTFFWIPHERIGRIIRNHGARRILFGTDAPWQEQSRILGAFAELPLTENDRRAICCENAMELFFNPQKQT